MDLVGPRPHPVSNYELFARSIPYYSLRSLVRPGLTGWAQVRQGYAHDPYGRDRENAIRPLCDSQTVSPAGLLGACRDRQDRSSGSLSD
jgi:hypothetical protein